MAEQWDYAVVGAGIVGLAVARALQAREPGASVLVLDKERGVAMHQTGHNSGVIHAGVYYEPGSLKARLCRAGLTRTVEFCRAHGIAHEQCGKLIVAVDDAQMARLRALYDRARSNGVSVELLDGPELRAREPAIAGLGAIYVRETGFVDYPGMCRRMAADIAASGELRLGTGVRAVRELADCAVVETETGEIRAGRVVVCAGLQADRLLRASGHEPDFAIVPFRGDYYALPPSRNALIRHHIYPVPDPSLPFLGIHLTRMVEGGITLGPSAMLALAREDYRKTGLNLRDALEAMRYPGLWRVLARYPRAGLAELGCALSRRLYLRAARRYCPSLTLDDLLPWQSGIRAQALGRDGRLIHDFLLHQTARTLHVCNAPSPAATAALPIADEIVGRLLGPAR
jgi:L-2-hydroxyglutarate oxidase